MSVRKLSWAAIFIALSAAGAFIKIPALIGSVALDSFPALLAAVLLGPASGAVIAGAGHIVSAILGGMPLGPFHFLIMFEMAILAWGYGTLYLAGKRMSAAVLFLIGNVLIAPLPFVFLISPQFYMAMLPSLLAASVINLVIAHLLAPRLTPIIEKLFSDKEMNR
ncbi:ECF transporter S component [Peribacillus cavernae]|uniref:ECF transporter S component n=1 Tax=Peribacillus cavernae TaxID=1674310 RepID=A0A433HTJ4_9BACI|nr:ECF transporter S component [Peribacillus cavernae]MDQ0218586.1 putative membrane protein [Peribacillus cavernae]RUQ31574.1 ECF transporter S component [Peribacillus cavernae]